MILCEPFAGSAALSYYMLHAKPPISYMGSKTGYAATIAAILGLDRRHPPAAFVLGEPGPMAGVHATLAGAEGSAVEVARWIQTGVWCYRQGIHFGGPILPGERRQDTRAVAVAVAVAGLPMPRAAEVAAIIRGWKDEEPRALWTRLKAEGWPSLMPVEGGRWLGPQSVEEVARVLWVQKRTRPGGRGFKAADYPDGSARHGGAEYHPEDPAPAIEALPAFPPTAVWQGTAETLELPADLTGWVIYMDPPYQGTTGYPHGTCDRATVLRLADDYARRGAVVAISEAVPLDRELGAGWHAVDITHGRKGQKRTFSLQQSEWLTLNRPPVWAPHQGQQPLFGADQKTGGPWR